MTRDLASELAAFARAQGFAGCGVAGLEPSRHGDALDRWLRAGYGGTMRYLHRQARKRKDPASIVRGARVAVMLLEQYRSDAVPSPPDAPRVRIARYARGTDYHTVLAGRLRIIADWLLEHGATLAHAWIDSGPVPERELARRAGLGWIGKNTMLIRPEAGSFCFIGTVFTDLALEPADAPDYDRCGSCTRCLDACPTGAFVAPYVLDATRCISYLTIESRAPIPESLEPRLAGWAFGCDICNEVCPWNARLIPSPVLEPLRPRGDPPGDDPGWFDRMDEPEFQSRYGDSALERAGLDGMRRNWTAAFRSVSHETETGEAR